MTKGLQVGNSPFDRAWVLIKRQTTLGEFHPDLPSPYGEHIAFYHGTTEPNAQKIMADKLRAKRGIHGTGAYVSNDYDNARRYAHAKVVHDKDWQGNKQKPMVLGVREGVFDNLNEPTVTQGTEDWMEEGFFPHGIPPQYLTRLPNDYGVEWGSKPLVEEKE